MFFKAARMNGLVHFSTGYLAGRALGYREYRFETLYVALAAYSPDFDIQLQLVSPFFAHGIWTHTLAGVAVMSFVLSVIAKGAMMWFKPSASVPFARLWGLALLGGMSHLLLDAFTFYESPADAIHHMYFWPVWNFSWHINTMFPAASYTLRVCVEVLYSIVVAAIILLYQWAGRKQNPFRMFASRDWFSLDRG
jgi:membrane-bound metal-dependent hydrolase YbcI (DUF457 family)